MFDVKDIRPFINITAPKPVNVSVESTYNFYVPDERVSEESASRYIGASSFEVQNTKQKKDGGTKIFFKDSDGNLTSEENIVGRVPRFNTLRFQTPLNVEKEKNLNYNLQEKFDEGVLQTADQVQLPFDVSMRFVDLSLAKRLTRKIDLAVALQKALKISAYTENKKSLGLTFTDTTFQKLQIGQEYGDALVKASGGTPYLNQERKLLTSIIDLNSSADTENVNELGQEFVLNGEIKDAQFMNLTAKIDRRILGKTLSSPTVTDNRFIRQMLNSFVVKDAAELSSLPAPLDPRLKELYLDAEGQDTLGEKVTPKITLAGYMIERYEMDETLEGSTAEKTFFVSTPAANNFIDPSIKYGIYYTYTVRSVYKIVNTITIDNVDKRVVAYLASETSDSVETRVLETTPPAEPDGVQFRFNYNRRKGLMIFWQFPVGTQRDTKYFQIFRRETIAEPFTCIGMIDFDNSSIKSNLRETVIPERVTKHSECITFYEDVEFQKNSKFIYAVAAIDAHGYSSGYSAQTKVEFDKSRNVLIMNTISQPGAPKQYPNFFVDPDEDRNVFVNSLTQDSMKTSVFKKMRLYFDPDGMKYTHDKLEGDHKYIFRANTLDIEKNPIPDAGLYKLVLINTDRQKASTIEIRIDDARGTGIFTQ
jgi:hypothetical protein